jgi:hypothetical protein
MIYDVRAALGHLYRSLKAGGVLLVTAHGISSSKIARPRASIPGEVLAPYHTDMRSLYPNSFWRSD